MSNAYIDYFKLFKIFDLKKLNKQGEVKLSQDKQLSRKVLWVDGNVSTQNYITFDTTSILNLSFKQRYLYILGCVDAGKTFCFELNIHLNTKIHKAVYSTVYKSVKNTQQGVLHLPLPDLKSSKWTVIVVDLYDLSEKHYCESDEIRMTFRLANVIIRANSKIKGIYQSDMLYDAETLPK